MLLVHLMTLCLWTVDVGTRCVWVCSCLLKLSHCLSKVDLTKNSHLCSLACSAERRDLGDQRGDAGNWWGVAGLRWCWCQAEGLWRAAVEKVVFCASLSSAFVHRPELSGAFTLLWRASEVLEFFIRGVATEFGGGWRVIGLRRRALAEWRGLVTWHLFCVYWKKFEFVLF